MVIVLLQISYFLGILLNEISNWVLKHMIREHRPIRDRQALFTEYGMPSSHAQFAWFFSTYMVFFLFIRVYRNYSWMDDLWKFLISLMCFVASSLVVYSRVYLGYHTFGQVSCGALLGVFLGAVWFGVVQLILTPFFPYLASHPIGEFFMLRDSTLIPHVLWFEYTSSRTEASITNFPFLTSNIPSSPAYGVFISQLIRYVRASTKYTDFVRRARRLSDKLLSQGYVCARLTSSLRKFYCRYGELVIHYDVLLSIMVDDILSQTI
ncbi:hypothetical protein FSP39_022132 [Pinctada imbricata]|uniref:Dolichyldiphosphatase 1 n=1 Tax=Pinctada imbricata TaxID=66713 RepID=A0AA88XMN9_PINIB|nr:hypothetical protein FSP39_022132 [Pinctada imbricata]